MIAKKEIRTLALRIVRIGKVFPIRLIREARSIYPDLAIVVISGYDTFSYAQTAMKYGVLEYLLKPVDDSALLGTLNSLAERLNAVMMQRQENNLIRTMKGYKLTEQQRMKRFVKCFFVFIDIFKILEYDLYNKSYFGGE